MPKPPKTGPAKWVNHLMGDDPHKPLAWCGRRLAYRHRLAATVERTTCRKCKKLITAAKAEEKATA